MTPLLLHNRTEYMKIHFWVYDMWGKASRCDKNKKHINRKYEWSNISKDYKKEREDWQQLCTSCHQRDDYGDFCKRGHRFTVENTSWFKRHDYPNRFRRQCKECQKLREAKSKGGFNHNTI